MSQARRRPLYARVLRLRHLQPSSLWCFLYFEGAVALGVLLALAEVVSWWAVLALPVAVAAMVKLNDLLTGVQAAAGWRPPKKRRANQRPAQQGAGPAVPESVPAPRDGRRMDPASRPLVRRAVEEPVGHPAGARTAGRAGEGREGRQVSRDVAGALDPVDSPRQRFRQSARRRYEE